MTSVLERDARRARGKDNFARHMIRCRRGDVGSCSNFDDAITEFADAYADQNSGDLRAVAEAVGNGRMAAHTGI